MESQNLKQHFSQWALVELMGHQRIAGLVSEADFPAGFVRIDVYESGEEDAQPVFTRVVSPSALYAINPVEKAIAVELAKRYRVKPVQQYEMANLLPAPEPVGPVRDEPQDDRPYDGDDEWPDEDEWEA